MNKRFTPLKVSAPVRTGPHPSTDQIRPEEKRTDLGEGLSQSVDSPSPNPLRREVWQILVSGVYSVSENDHGRPWPLPNRAGIARLLAEYDDDLCLTAAREAKEIVQSQDRAPNITNLFAKKLADLAEVRATIRGSLEAV
jgi:hypothetical protein